jgi:hypothetical protein
MANRHKKARALRDLPSMLPDWDRIRQRFANMAHRGTKLPILSTGVRVRASSPEELKRKSDEALANMVSGEPEN